MMKHQRTSILKKLASSPLSPPLLRKSRSYSPWSWPSSNRAPSRIQTKYSSSFCSNIITATTTTTSTSVSLPPSRWSTTSTEILRTELRIPIQIIMSHITAMRPPACHDPVRRRFFSTVTSSSSSDINNSLNPPSTEDIYHLWNCMDRRPGSVISSLSSINMTGADDGDQPDFDQLQSKLQKYAQDWTRNPKWSYQWFQHQQRQHHQRQVEMEVDKSSPASSVEIVVVRPISSLEVAKILNYCSNKRIGVVPQGGNTGLVGGSVPVSNEIILSLECMDRIITPVVKEETIEDDDDDDDDSTRIVTNNILRAEAGCILQDLQDFASKNLKALVPVDLGAKGTCQIGGNLSTNAGGVYYYRYGSLHANVIGIEVVIPPPVSPYVDRRDDEKDNLDDDAQYYKNQIMSLGYHPTTARLKDNTGYDLKHLFIGAEGTLGIITKVALVCPPLPSSIQAVWLKVESLENVLHILNAAKNQYLNEILGAFEFMDDGVLKLVQQTHASVAKSSILNDSTTSSSSSPSYCVLIETHGSNEDHDQDKLQQFLTYVMDEGWVVDGVLAQNRSQVQEFWQIREVCNPAAAATGHVYKYDLSLSVTDFDDFISEIKQRLLEYNNNNHGIDEDDIDSTSDDGIDLVCVNWGHIIDGNLHCNVVTPGVFEEDPNIFEYIESCIYDAVLKRHGSISAEHGLGQYKNNKLSRIKDSTTLRSMVALKEMFDPVGILNPNKFLPTNTRE